MQEKCEASVLYGSGPGLTPNMLNNEMWQLVIRPTMEVIEAYLMRGKTFKVQYWVHEIQEIRTYG